jgi:hypothetical protein
MKSGIPKISMIWRIEAAIHVNFLGYLCDMEYARAG